MTTYEDHQACADVLETLCVAAYGTEYAAWPAQIFRAYAEHLMLGNAAMTDEEADRRFHAEQNPQLARDESVAYWITILTDDTVQTLRRR